MTDRTWDDAASHLLDQLHETLVTKQYDYGHQNILFAGMEGVLVRAHDKIARIKNLLGRDEQAANESLRDSWVDLAGYAIIALMLMDGTFTRPLACDVDTPDSSSKLADDMFWLAEDRPPVVNAEAKILIEQALARHEATFHQSRYVNDL